MSDDVTIGSRFIISLEGTVLNQALLSTINSYNISSFLLSSKNIVGEKQLKHLIKSIRNARKDSFIILNYDESCNSRCNSFMTPIPTPLALSATGDEGNAYTVGKLQALELKEIGFDAIIGPSLDLHSHNLVRESNRMSFSNLGDIVSRFGIAMINGYCDGGLLPIAHTFPGISNIYTEDEFSIGMNDKTSQELKNGELYPFERAIEKDSPAILIAPYYYKAFDDQPVIASMSYSLIDEYMRGELAYNGIIISPQIDQVSISDHFPLETVAIESLRSGCDMIIIGENHEHIQKIYDSYKESIDTSYITWDEHLRAINRLQSIKDIENNTDVANMESHKAIVHAIIERSVTLLNKGETSIPELGDNPLFLSKINERENSISFALWMKEALGGDAFEFSLEISNSEMNHLLEEASDNTSIVIAIKDGYNHPSELALANSLGAMGIPTIAISVKDPYDILYLQPSICSIAIYEESVYSFEALRKVLTKERNATGNLSIHW